MTDVAAPWLDSYPPGVPQHVEFPQVNLARLLADAARDFPHAPALHFEGRTVSYAELADQAWRFAGALARLGVTKGTRVGLVLPNCPQAVVAFFATLRLGAVVVQNNPLYTERELGRQLGDAGVEVVICLDVGYERVKALRERLGIREVVVTSLLDELLAVVARYRPTLLPGVPTIYVAINNAVAKGGHDLSSIKACLSGGAPLPLEVAERFERFSGGRLVEGYGLSESAPVAVANPIYGKRKAGTIGMPLPDTLARVADPEDPSRTLPRGKAGELALRGPQVMLGYWNRPDESEQVLRDGWLLTGDMAVMDEEGYFSIVDRKKDLIISGGYNIYPREVEEVLYEHPKIEEVCVAGVPDPYRGETVKAFVVLRGGEQATVEEIREFAKSRLAAYKVPRAVEFRDALPMTMVGKVLRRALVEEERARADAEASAR